MELRLIDFNKEGISTIKENDDVMNWPVVYILEGKEGSSRNKTEVYVGETCDIASRLVQHLANRERKSIIHAHILFDKRMNKSVTLDIEQNLIRLYDAEEKYRLQNHNGGQSADHLYYEWNKYRSNIPKIWDLLIEKGLAQTPYDVLVNSIFFKYSPYTKLTNEQLNLKEKLLNTIVNNVKNNVSSIHVINGGAGTGKTMVALNILYSLISEKNLVTECIDLDNHKIEIKQQRTSLENPNTGRPFKVGLVVPMVSLRHTLKKVAKNAGIASKYVIGPYEMVREAQESTYDIIIVDETHRLLNKVGDRRIAKYYDGCCESLGLKSDECTQLDWVKKCSKCCIFFYDEKQTIRANDITPEQFSKTVGICERYELKTQMRCKGGKPFIDYVSDILACKNPERHDSFENQFTFVLCEHIDELVKTIRELDEKEDLCRVVAGYSWKWVTQDLSDIDFSDPNHPFDIQIEGHRYVWNKKGGEWILNENSRNTIGCIHTCQGYDLNYVGVIFGREIDYNPDNNEIVINANLFEDNGVKSGSTPEALKQHILNAYAVMMTRGIKGCYIYAYNSSLRDYLKKYVPQIS